MAAAGFLAAKLLGKPASVTPIPQAVAKHSLLPGKFTGPIDLEVSDEQRSAFIIYVKCFIAPFLLGEYEMRQTSSETNLVRSTRLAEEVSKRITGSMVLASPTQANRKEVSNYIKNNAVMVSDMYADWKHITPQSDLLPRRLRKAPSSGRSKYDLSALAVVLARMDTNAIMSFSTVSSDNVMTALNKENFPLEGVFPGLPQFILDLVHENIFWYENRFLPAVGWSIPGLNNNQLKVDLQSYYSSLT